MRMCTFWTCVRIQICMGCRIWVWSWTQKEKFNLDLVSFLFKLFSHNIFFENGSKILDVNYLPIPKIWIRLSGIQLLSRALLLSIQRSLWEHWISLSSAFICINWILHYYYYVCCLWCPCVYPNASDLDL